uniref:DNA polymerase n=1 Tax=Meloidogyne incognita TaxID=6306 RepID=A0A914MF01_MELIC
MSPKKKVSPKKRSAPRPIHYAKRTKPEDDKNGFVNKLAALGGSLNGGDDNAGPSSDGTINGARTYWERPKVDSLIKDGRNDKPVLFQLMDIDSFIEGNAVVMRLFGVTDRGNSVAVCVFGYRPYFFASVPPSFGAQHIQKTIELLNSHIKGGLGMVTGIEIVQGSSLYYYSNTNTKRNFLKIFISSHRLFAACRGALYLIDKMLALESVDSKRTESCHAFESNLDYEVCFMADLGIVGCGWIECPSGKYDIVPENKQTTCSQFEVFNSNSALSLINYFIKVKISVDFLLAHDASSHEWSGVAPLRTLSLDIECLGQQGTFPDASRDPIIQIANMVKLEGESEPFIRNCFVLGTCESIVGSEVIECRNEVELLSKWSDFVRTVDPDVITGYNIQNFDLPYIMDRAKHLKIDGRVCYLSRVKGNICKQRDVSLQSKQMGNRVNKMCSMDGRIIFDVLQLVLRDYKLRSYTLNNVSYFFLGEQKEDVAYNFIPELQEGSAKDRRRLAVYCMKDAYLPIRLLDKLMLFINYMEMARVTGVPLSFLISRGQQVKILSMLIRKTREKNIFLPVIDVGDGGDEIGYEGATVIEPVCDFYNEPISTLDFASLYPSIMIAHNLCYTTLMKTVPPENEMVEGVDYIKTPSGDLFVSAKHRKGLLPQVLEELLSARKKAKEALKKETDPLKKMVLDGRQLALKISANSVYGFTGASKGKLPCSEVAQSVTAFGRQMIELTKKEVEGYYKTGAVDGLCPIDAKVIYGDTDSVMVKFGVKTIGEAMTLGKHAAQEISKRFLKPIKLEFEKVYFPYLLINKKRYAGLFWTKEEKHDKMDCKGLETVRRDNCPLVACVLNSCLEKLLIERDKDGAIRYAKGVISDLLNDRIDISMLTITKELTKKGEKYAAKQAHVELAERMRKRDPGSAPRLGDRVPYVIINKGANVPAYEKAEDPIWHQLVKPMARIFDPLLDNRAEQIFTNGRQLALKISANSVYGFTGASKGKLPCSEVAQSVTAFGRQMIELTKKEVEGYYKTGAVDGLCPIDAKVIYGDTDSVMKYAAKQAHVELAERMRKRDPGSAPRLGDRVPYVIINKGANVPAYEKAEDPIWVLKNNIPIDTTYYLEHQLVKPMARIFDPLLDNRAEQIFTSGDHTKKKTMVKLKSGLMAGYLVKKATCLGCKAPMNFKEEQAPATCSNCVGKMREIYLEKIVAIRSAEHRFSRLWTECQNCAGLLQDEVFCASRDCPIFYMREKVRNDLEDLEKMFRRFQIHSKQIPILEQKEVESENN